MSIQTIFPPYLHDSPYAHITSQRWLLLLFLEVFTKVAPHRKLLNFEYYPWGFTCQLTEALEGADLLLQVLEEEMRRSCRLFQFEVKSMMTACVEGYVSAHKLELLGEIPDSNEVVDLYLLPSVAILLQPRYEIDDQQERQAEENQVAFGENERMQQNFALLSERDRVFGFVAKEKKLRAGLKKRWVHAFTLKTSLSEPSVGVSMLGRRRESELIDAFEESCQEAGVMLPLANSLYLPNVDFSEVEQMDERRFGLGGGGFYTYALHTTVEDPLFWRFPEGHHLEFEIAAKIGLEEKTIESCCRALQLLHQKLHLQPAIEISGGSKKLDIIKQKLLQKIPGSIEVGMPIAYEIGRPGFLLIEFFVLDQLLRPTVCSAIQIGLQRKSESVGCTCRVIPYVGIERICALLYTREDVKSPKLNSMKEI